MSILSKFFSFYMGKVQVISSSAGTKSRRDYDIETQEQCSSIIDCNATHIARGKVLHVRMDDNGRVSKIYRSSEYTKLFERPNPLMTRQDFMYVMAYNYQVFNLAIAWVKWVGCHPVEVWPVVYKNAEVKETIDGGFVLEFTDFDSTRRVVRLEDCIVLRRRYNGVGYVGQDNEAVKDVLEQISNLDEGMNKATAISNKIHGLLTQKNAMLATKSAKESQKDFKERMDAAAKEGGVVALDATEQYTPLNVSAWTANAAQAKQVYERVYTYWRTPLEIVNNTASEQVNQNYYDGIVEPAWEEMAEAFTKALFTDNEQNYGQRMIVTSGAATGASWQTKLNIINSSKEQGLLSVNEQRELLGYAPTEDGDVRLVSLNYINSKDQSAYQVGNDSDGAKPNGDEPKEDEPNEEDPNEESEDKTEKEGEDDGKGTGEEEQADS